MTDEQTSENLIRELNFMNAVNSYCGFLLLERPDYLKITGDKSRAIYLDSKYGDFKSIVEIINTKFFDLKCKTGAKGIFISNNSIENFGEKDDEHDYRYLLCLIDTFFITDQQKIIDNTFVIENTSMKKAKNNGTLDGMEDIGTSGDKGYRFKDEYIKKRWDSKLSLKDYLDKLIKNIGEIDRQSIE